jgi:hypothetical protein
MPRYVAWAPTPWNGRLGCIYSPQHKTSHWRKVVLSMAHLTVHCSLSGAPSRWFDTAGDRLHVGFLHRTLRMSHRTIRWSSLHSATWN